MHAGRWNGYSRDFHMTPQEISEKFSSIIKHADVSIVDLYKNGTSLFLQLDYGNACSQVEFRPDQIHKDEYAESVAESAVRLLARGFFLSGSKAFVIMPTPMPGFTP